MPRTCSAGDAVATRQARIHGARVCARIHLLPLAPIAFTLRVSRWRENAL